MLTSTVATRTESDPSYSEFERLIANRVASLRGPLFTTNADGLFDAYLSGIPEERRQHYNCQCCKRFITNYGGLVTIGGDDDKAEKATRRRYSGRIAERGSRHSLR